MAWVLRAVGATLGGCLFVAVQIAGCATGEGVETGGDDDGAASSGGQGAVGGAGGEAGMGGGSPCGTDCSTIATASCQQAICNPDTGQCEVVPQQDGTSCDDGLFCTVDDACVAGECEGGPQNDCGMVPTDCEIVTCDEASESCSLDSAADGTSCTSDDLCLENTICDNGLCVGQAKDCFFAPVDNDCHTAVCNPSSGQCESMPDSTKDGDPCTDPMALCTEQMTCSAGTCQGGMPKDCSHLDQGCIVGTCDVATGACINQPLMNGDPCDDQNACTVGETCSSAVCYGGTAITSCTNNDGCCPSTCGPVNDSDCALEVLLMGDDVTDDANGWGRYRNALSAAGVSSWDEINLVSAPFPTASTLAQYNTLIWFDESTLAQTNADCQVVVNWLENGDKHLFITSVDFLWDLQNGAVGQGEHNLYQLTGAPYLGDFAGTGITVLSGLAGDPVGQGLGSMALTGDSNSNGDYATFSGGAAVDSALYSQGGAGSLSTGLTRYANLSYKLVWLGVNFHNGLANASHGNQLMINIINYFKQ